MSGLATRRRRLSLSLLPSLSLSLSVANPSTADFPKSTGVYESMFRIVPSRTITRWTTLARAAVRPGRWQPVLFPFYVPSCDNDQWSLESPQQQQQQQQQQQH
jgi:RES domain-containing protein